MSRSAWHWDGWVGGPRKTICAGRANALRGAGTGLDPASTPGIGAVRWAIPAGRAADSPAVAATGAASAVAVPVAAAQVAAGENGRLVKQQGLTMTNEQLVKA